MRRSEVYAYKGKRQRLGAWARELRIPYSVLYFRLHRMRWTVEKAFGTPIRPRPCSGVAVSKVSSTLRINGKHFVFLYPKPQPEGEDFAEIREIRQDRSLVPGRTLDEPRSWSAAISRIARKLELLDGHPALAWIEGCFQCARDQRTSRAIKVGILQAAEAYQAHKTKEHLLSKQRLLSAKPPRKGRSGRGGSPAPPFLGNAAFRFP